MSLFPHNVILFDTLSNILTNAGFSCRRPSVVFIRVDERANVVYNSPIGTQTMEVLFYERSMEP